MHKHLRPKEVRGHWIAIMIIASGIVLGFCALQASPIGPWAEQHIADIWFGVRDLFSDPSPPEEVVIVGIDEATFAELGTPIASGFSRSKYAELISTIGKANPSVIALDVLLNGEGKDEKGNEELVEAIRATDTIIAAFSKTIEVQGIKGPEQRTVRIEPHPMFANSATEVAWVGVSMTAGVVRTYLDFLRTPPGFRPLSLAAARRTRPEILIPNGWDFINYYGPPNTIKTISAGELLTRPDEFLSYLEDKIVFVGARVATGSGGRDRDIFGTPVGDAFGVEIHATRTANIIRGDWIRRIYPVTELGILAGVLAMASVAILSLRGPLKALIFIVAFAGIWSVVSYNLFLQGYFVPGIVLVLVVLPLLAGGSAFYYYWVVDRMQAFLRRAFSEYVGPDLLALILDDPNKLALRGELVRGFPVFTDAEGFTPFTSKHAQNPEYLRRVVSRLLELQTDEVLKNDGTYIRQTGDGIYAYWNAPHPVEDAGDKAVQAALGIQKAALKAFRDEELPKFTIRIGIHYGFGNAGNWGSKKRFEYAVFGDSVNTASRLEGLNKRLGTSILISQEAKEQLLGTYSMLEMGKFCFVGKDESCFVYAVFESSLNEEAVSHWQQGLCYFKEEDWEHALVCFTRSSEYENRLMMAASFYKNEVERRQKHQKERGPYLSEAIQLREK